jgi:cation diffusion facilitator family transporter
MPHDSPIGGGPGRLAPVAAKAIVGRVTALSVATACALAAMKLGAVLASGSVAVLASLADSALDVFASVVTFFAVRYAAQPADNEHRFGHGKAETFAALVQAGVITLSAALLAREAVNRFLNPSAIAHGGWAIAVMVVSIAATIGLVWAQSHAVRKTGSLAVTGDRLHYSSDLAANFAVILGVILAMFGAGWADPLVAAGIAAWLLWGAWQIAVGAYNQMMDRELPDEDRDRIRALALDDPAVLQVHDLRTRASGPLVHVQFHADLDPALTLEAAHKVMVEAEKRILAVYPGADILIHPDPAGRAESHGADHFRRESADAAE